MELKERVAQLEAALSALVSRDDAAVVSQYSGNDYFACAYCEAQADERADVQHAPDCPIVRGREVLGG